MSDDRWRDNYDSWKLATPPEYEISPEEEDRVYEEARETRADAIILSESQQNRAIEIVQRLADGWRQRGYLDNEAWGMDDLRNLLAEISSLVVQEPPEPEIKF